MKLAIHEAVCILCVITSIIGAIMNMAYFADTAHVSPTVHIFGILFHVVPLAIILLLSSYLGRYLSGYQNNRATERYGKRFNSIIAYILAPIYWFFAMIYLTIIADSHNNNVNLSKIDPCSLGFIIYFSSSVILWFWLVVSKPLIPNIFYALGITSHSCYLPPDEKRNLNRAKHGRFANVFTHELFYEHPDDANSSTIWSSISLLLMFCVSVAFMNSSFAIYFNNRLYHDIMVGLTTGSTMLAMLLQSLIFVGYYKGWSTFEQPMKDNFAEVMKVWIGIVVCWVISSLVTACIYLPLDGKWTVDTNFVETSMQRNVFYMVQASPIVPMVIVGLIAGVYYFGKCLRWCFCSQLAGEIDEAKNKVAGYTIKLTDETIPFTNEITDV